MATIDMADFLGANIAMSSHSTRFVFTYHEAYVDLVAAATEKGSALAAADVIQAIDVQAGSVIFNAGLEVLTANAGSSVLTFDLGVTGVEPDNFVDGYDFVAAIVGDYAQNAAAYQPLVIGNTADTIDLLIATLTTTNTAGKVRVWAIIGTIQDDRKPGLTALKS